MPVRRTAISSSGIYAAFLRLPPEDWVAATRFYERHKDGMGGLPPAQRMDILSHYVLALHHLKDYQGVVGGVESLLPLSLSDEIPAEEGLPVYEEALSLKANAHHRLMEYREANHILAELSRLNPARKEYAHRRTRSLYMDKPPYNRLTRAATVALLLLSAVVILLEILFIKTLHLRYAEFAAGFRNILFVAGLALFIVGEAAHWLLCRRRAQGGQNPS